MPIGRYPELGAARRSPWPCSYMVRMRGGRKRRDDAPSRSSTASRAWSHDLRRTVGLRTASRSRSRLGLVFRPCGSRASCVNQALGRTPAEVRANGITVTKNTRIFSCSGSSSEQPVRCVVHQQLRGPVRAGQLEAGAGVGKRGHFRVALVRHAAVAGPLPAGRTRSDGGRRDERAPRAERPGGCWQRWCRNSSSSTICISSASALRAGGRGQLVEVIVVKAGKDVLVRVKDVGRVELRLVARCRLKVRRSGSLGHRDRDASVGERVVIFWWRAGQTDVDDVAGPRMAVGLRERHGCLGESISDRGAHHARGGDRVLSSSRRSSSWRTGAARRSRRHDSRCCCWARSRSSSCSASRSTSRFRIRRRAPASWWTT